MDVITVKSVKCKGILNVYNFNDVGKSTKYFRIDSTLSAQYRYVVYKKIDKQELGICRNFVKFNVNMLTKKEWGCFIVVYGCK